eukprot:scaffold4518_cov129-Isochrysis_galbana.AAC.2
MRVEGKELVRAEGALTEGEGCCLRCHIHSAILAERLCALARQGARVINPWHGLVEEKGGGEHGLRGTADGYLGDPLQTLDGCSQFSAFGQPHVIRQHSPARSAGEARI